MAVFVSCPDAAPSAAAQTKESSVGAICDKIAFSRLDAPHGGGVPAVGAPDLSRQLAKIATLSSVEEADGYAWGAEITGRRMLPEEKIALQRRRDALGRKG